MKKIILFLIAFSFLQLSASAEPFMDKALSSWVGYPLDAAIDYWGYPDSQQNIAGRNIYIWEEKSTYEDGTYERSYVKTDKKGRTYVDTYSSGGGTTEFLCRRILEVNSNNIISGYKYKGNACPGVYLFKAKKYVNPANNEWEKRKQEKQIQKGRY